MLDVDNEKGKKNQIAKREEEEKEEETMMMMMGQVESTRREE
jgi:hypothetical protein